MMMNNRSIKFYKNYLERFKKEKKIKDFGNNKITAKKYLNF